jgi:hypothetical protein
MKSEEGEVAARRVRSANLTSLRVACAAAMGGFLFGFDSSVINGAVDAIKAQFHLGWAGSWSRRHCWGVRSVPGSPGPWRTGSAGSG